MMLRDVKAIELNALYTERLAVQYRLLQYSNVGAPSQAAIDIDTSWLHILNERINKILNVY